jgi:hypothetical protein
MRFRTPRSLVAAIAGLVLLAAPVSLSGAFAEVRLATATEQPGSAAVPLPVSVPVEPDEDRRAPERVELPGGGTKVFGHRRFLTAYYGTAGTGVLGVLGETDIDTAHQRVLRAGRPFLREGEQLLPVYELIVTVADAGPGDDGDFSHDINARSVEPYVRAARRNGALLVLDLQPGRSDFLTVAKRWRWALKKPYVGLALDPEWRMGPREVPGRTLGQVSAREVNRVSAWLAGIVEERNLPEKVFMLHQFRSDMIPDIDRVKSREGLALVQHVDGFGNPGQKLATYHAVARPKLFSMGFKLFYDEDRPRMTAAAVRRITPPVRFVSFQ